MKCARASKLIQLYVDDRLSQAKADELQRHLSVCADCREELAALLSLRESIVATDLAPEPADLTDAIMRRIAVVEARKAEARKAEARKAEALERRPEFLPAWAGWRSIGVSAVLVALLVTALLPGGWIVVVNTLSRDLAGVINALLEPGPDQVTWAVWLAGGLVTLVVVVWFMRTDASSQWRRAISERFPQLW